MVKKKNVGHWGTVPGQNFVFLHMDRSFKWYDPDLILLSVPGHGGNLLLPQVYPTLFPCSFSVPSPLSSAIQTYIVL